MRGREILHMFSSFKHWSTGTFPDALNDDTAVAQIRDHEKCNALCCEGGGKTIAIQVNCCVKSCCDDC